MHTNNKYRMMEMRKTLNQIIAKTTKSQTIEITCIYTHMHTRTRAHAKKEGRRNSNKTVEQDMAWLANECKEAMDWRLCVNGVKLLQISNSIWGVYDAICIAAKSIPWLNLHNVRACVCW